MAKKNTVANWLEDRGMPCVEAAAKYEVGQNLTPDEAGQVRRIVNRSFLDSEHLEILADTVELICPANVPFMTLMSALIDAGSEYNTNWSEALYDTFDKMDVKTLRKIKDKK